MNKRISLSIIFLAVILLMSFVTKAPKNFYYLPLGDSYTICTGATEKESWPFILTQHLTENRINCKLLDNPARNGFTTQNLIDYELPILKKLKPNFVTLLIGVNDWVRGVSKQKFSTNLDFILNDIEKHIPYKKNIILITIPNFGVTPQGKNYSSGRDITKGIAEFNAIIIAAAKKRNLLLADVYELSLKMKDDSSLISSDGLHPSAKEYSLWEKQVLEKALLLLNNKGD